MCIFASQSELRHLQPTVSVCVYVCLHMILGQMPNFGKFFLVNRVIYSSLFVFYVSQSELRHLQCPVSVCVCACIPLYVCVSHICFKNMAALSLKMAAPPAVALVQNLARIQKKESNRYLPKLAMLFGVAPSAKNSDFTARLRHLPALFIYLFFAPSTFFWCIYLRHISKVLLASIWMQWGLTRLKPPAKESQQRFISRTCISDPKSARVRVNPN